jgi:alpha-1,2-mannosyltransferase
MPILDRERLTTYPKIILFLYVVIYGFLIFSGSGYADRMGKPIGGDFSAFWATSLMVLSGEAASVYDDERIFAAEQSVTGIDYRNPVPYPPVWFFVIAPLALFAYIPSLILWLTLTFSAFLYVTCRFAPHALTVWLTLSFPGTFQNVIHGHNGFVTTSILGFSLLIIEKYPFTAGLVLGLLSFKPHLVMIVPLFLVIGKLWRTLTGLIVSVLFLVLTSVILFGIDAWFGFLEKIPFLMQLMENGYLQMHQIVSTLGALLLMEMPYMVAVWIHLLCSLIGIGFTAMAWSKNEPGYVKHSLLVLTVLLVTPYSNSYDLTLLALPICWIGWEAHKRGKISNRVTFFLIAAWFLPLLTVDLAVHLRFQPAPFAILGMVIWIYTDTFFKPGGYPSDQSAMTQK